jgi:hypothetical protein
VQEIRQHGRVGMVRDPRRPRHDRRGDQGQRFAVEQTGQRGAPWLRPNAFGLMAPPGHRLLVQRSLIAKGERFIA